MTKRRRYDSSDEYEEFGKDIAGEENPNIILTVCRDKMFLFQINLKNGILKYYVSLKRVSFCSIGLKSITLSSLHIT